MSIKALAEYTRISKYSKYLPEKKRRETWEEQINRVFDMHEKHLGDKLDSIKEDFYFAKDMMLKKRILGSQRALQFGGDPILKKHERIFNCSASYCDRPRFFQEAMFVMLAGTGVGASFQKLDIDKLPTIKRRSDETVTFVVEDSIEGWADSLGALVSSYFSKNQPFPQLFNKKLIFDFSKIRIKGSSLSWGGKAPGPEGLKKSLELIEKLFEDSLTLGQERLTTVNAYDILMFTANCVISGGVRRAACICLFSPDDDEMAKAKTGDWFIKNPQRGRSNNSALLVRHEISREKFGELFKSTKEFGEPGFIWAENNRVLFNPCCEISLYGYDEKGNSGWEFCNLTTINIKKCKTEEDFLQACKASAIVGTIQATYNKFPYLGEVTERINAREALLGCSMTGIMETPSIALNPEIQKKGAKLIVKTNEKISKLLEINAAARCCALKPEGSASCLLGTSSGIHPHHSKRYIRRVQANVMEVPLQYFEAHNPRAVEKSVWSQFGNDKSISFLCEVPDGSIVKNQVSAIDLLKNVMLTQQNWVEYGTTDRSVKPWLRHNTSNTISVKDDEWDEVEKFIYNNKQWFAGISLLPFSGDLDYPQAPFTNVLNEKEIITEYGEGALFASGLIVDGLFAFSDNLWAACDCALGIGEPIQDIKQPSEPIRPAKNGYTDKQHASKLIVYANDLKLYYEELEKFNKENIKKDWLRRFKQFADRYVNGDLRKCSHLLKHVSIWKLWLDLKREYQDVDWELCFEEDFKIDVSTMGAQACAGGKCEL